MGVSTLMSGIQFGAGGFIGAAEWTQERLQGLGVALPAGARFAKANALIRKANAGKVVLVENDECTLHQLTEAHWTIFEYYIIARAIRSPEHALSRELLKKLEAMVSGAETEDEDRNPLARNTQFELYTAATLTMGGVQTQLAEPDLHVDYLGMTVGIAAKRVRSAKQLLRRAKDAVEQIKSSGLPGIVALNVDVLLKRAGVAPPWTDQFSERLTALKGVDNELSRHHEVLGSLVIARDAIWQFSRNVPEFHSSVKHRFWIYPRNSEQESRGTEFWHKVHACISRRFRNL